MKGPQLGATSFANHLYLDNPASGTTMVLGCFNDGSADRGTITVGGAPLMLQPTVNGTVQVGAYDATRTEKLWVNGSTRLEQGVTFNNAGGGTAAALNDYTADTVTGQTTTGALSTAALSVDMYATRIGRVVNLHITSFSGTANNNGGIGFSELLAAQFRPISGTEISQTIPVRVGAAYQTGRLRIQDTGAIAIYADQNTGGFTNAATAGINGCVTVTYRV
jgi:hypothetical protein